MDAVGRRVRRGLAPGEPADLRAGEPLEGARSGVLRQHVGPAHRGLDLAAFGPRARVQPDGRDRAREERHDLRRQRPPRMQHSEPTSRGVVEIDAAVLLRRARDGRQAVERQPLFGQPREEQVERLHPHHRRRLRHRGIGVRQHAVPGAVVAQRLVEGERQLADDAVAPARGLEHDRAQALRARVEPQIQGAVGRHQAAPRSRSITSWSRRS